MASPSVTLGPPLTSAPEHAYNLLVKRLRHPKQRDHDINCTITLVPEFVKLLQRSVNIALLARPNYGLDDNGVGLIADFEDVVPGNEAEPSVGGLQVVNRLTHVTLGREDERRKSIVVILHLDHKIALEIRHMNEGVWRRETHLLHLTNLQQPFQYLLIPQLGIAQDRTPTLNRLYDLVAHIARKAEPRRVGEDFHCSPQGLLGAGGHAAFILEQNEF